MTADDRFNEGVKLRATFLNAIAIGAIVAGGFGALSAGNWLAMLLFAVVGIGLHGSAVKTLDNLKVANGH